MLHVFEDDLAPPDPHGEWLLVATETMWVQIEARLEAERLMDETMEGTC